MIGLVVVIAVVVIVSVVVFGEDLVKLLESSRKTVEIRGKSGGWAAGGLLGHRQYVVSVTVYNYGEKALNVTVCAKAIQEQDFWIKKEKVMLDAEMAEKLTFKFPEVVDYWFPSENQLPNYDVWLEYD